ncbi:MAG: glycosyltransferase family 2 protein [Lachnospiraceae bacterium]|nr:glycosyltransferase family 2 protein [Lachnospiraceae bacterium]
MNYDRQPGVPAFTSTEFAEKESDYAVLIPVINEGERIITELNTAYANRIHESADIIICDGGSTDGSMEEERLKSLGVNTLLVKKDTGKQGAQFRMGMFFALKRGYKGIITIDGNNKDSIEDIPAFIAKLKEGYGYVQGSRFVKGGHAENTPVSRYLALRLLHAPVISIAAHHKFTDTTSAYRAYSAEYLKDERVAPLRDIFVTYELLAYLSVRASQLGYKVCEIPVSRRYPKKGKTPTKISFLSGNMDLLKCLFNSAFGKYNP